MESPTDCTPSELLHNVHPKRCGSPLTDYEECLDPDPYNVKAMDPIMSERIWTIQRTLLGLQAQEEEHDVSNVVNVSLEIAHVAEDIDHEVKQLRTSYDVEVPAMQREIEGMLVLYEEMKRAVVMLRHGLKSILSPQESARCDLASNSRIAIYRALGGLKHTKGIFNCQFRLEATGAETLYLGDYEELAGAAVTAARALSRAEGYETLESFISAHDLCSHYLTTWNINEHDSRIRTFRALSVITSQLNVQYEKGKKRLSSWLKTHASSLGIDDFDSQRERGLNIRSPNTLPMDVTSAHRGMLQSMPEDIAACVSFLESIAPGLLILMTPDFLNFALDPSFAFHSLTPDDAFLGLNSMVPGDRTKYRGYLSNRVDSDSCLLPLFSILSGENNGPWSRSLARKTFKDSQEHAYELAMKSIHRSQYSWSSRTSDHSTSTSSRAMPGLPKPGSYDIFDNVRIHVASSGINDFSPICPLKTTRITAPVVASSGEAELRGAYITNACLERRNG